MKLATSYEIVTFDITGTSPLVQHNIRMADPLDPFTRALAEITGKRGKTLDDHERMARVEFEGGLYHDDDIGPYVPAEWVWKAITKAGGLFKKGAALQRGLMVDTQSRMFPIQYDGPRDIDGLYQDGRFVLRKAIGVQGSKTIRTRPMFPDWRIDARLIWNPTAVDFDTVERAISEAGAMTGIGDGRTIGYGRFHVEVTR